MHVSEAVGAAQVTQKRVLHGLPFLPLQFSREFSRPSDASSDAVEYQTPSMTEMNLVRPSNGPHPLDVVERDAEGSLEEYEVKTLNES